MGLAYVLTVVGYASSYEDVFIENELLTTEEDEMSQEIVYDLLKELGKANIDEIFGLAKKKN
jgi:hypothetical protein